jgi:acyl homoserine lactone synthase
MRAAAQQLTLHVLTLPRDAARWNLVTAYLRLRKDVFIDRMNWSLHAHGSTEFEQYDHFGTTYVIAEDPETGEVVGGARLLRTDQASPNGSGRVTYSYMIRDAALGLLEDLPIDVSRAEVPVDGRVWELTRLISRGTARVAEAILSEVRRFLSGVGAERCLFLGPKAFMRMASRMGFEPQPLGQVVENLSGHYLAFSCDVPRADPGERKPVDAVAASMDLNIGWVRELHLASDETILATTYEWSQTGKRVTIWHETSRCAAVRVVEIRTL